MGCFKARKYIFPSVDNKHSGYCEEKYSDLQLLEHFMGTSVGRVGHDQYKYYCQLTGRNVKYKEVSQLGIPCTIYDIRSEKRKYEKLNPEPSKSKKTKTISATVSMGETSTFSEMSLKDLSEKYENDKVKFFNDINECLNGKLHPPKKLLEDSRNYQQLEIYRNPSYDIS